jgi:hypothetical protein
MNFGKVSFRLLGSIVLGVVVSPAFAQDWDSVPVRSQSAYQDTYLNGSWVSAYTGGFPLRLQGVVLNANEDWLDPTAAFDPGYTPYSLGGQAEIVVQATAPGDFGGTFCWMGQNYGNMPKFQDSYFSYTNTEWYEELNRLHLWHPSGAGLPESLPSEQLVRPGDYVEIRTRAGLWYGGKMNVNEQHFDIPDVNIEVVVLERGRGWDCPPNLTLADLKNADDTFIFDAVGPRASGGEHYQGTQVTLRNVHFVNPSLWGKEKDLVLADDTGRTFGVHLSLGGGFASFSAPAGTFSITGIVDQKSGTGNDGYRLLAMNSGDLFQTWQPAEGSNSWSSAANWDGNSPVAGEAVHFGGSAGGTAVNDLAGHEVGGIVFEPDAGAFTLSGNAVTLTGDLVSFSEETQTVALALTLSDEEHTIYSVVGEIEVQSALQNDGYLRKIGHGSATFSGGIVGDGTLDVANGTLNATSIVQNSLIIGGAASASQAAAVPEPAAWISIVAGLLISLAGFPIFETKGKRRHE